MRTVSQVILPLLKSDLYEVIQSTLDGLLCTAPPVWLENRAAITVVMASQGYPGDYAKGVEVAGERWRAEAGHCRSGLPPERCGSALLFVFPLFLRGWPIRSLSGSLLISVLLVGCGRSNIQDYCV